MLINSVTEIYFSPTNTTKKIINAIAEGMSVKDKEILDITSLKSREAKNPAVNGDIVIIGVPVYEEKVPELIKDYLQNLNGNNKPVVIVGVYGNIAEGIVLNELDMIMSNAGFKVIAAATFIGEHSFSTDKINLAKNRPDNNDLKNAEEFGQNIMKKIENINDLNETELIIPEGRLLMMAKIAPKNSARLITNKPDVDKSLCINCNICVNWCPVGAIDKQTLEIDGDKCIRCFSCVKRCPKKARKIIYKPDFIVSKILTQKNREHKEPKLYFTEVKR